MFKLIITLLVLTFLVSCTGNTTVSTNEDTTLASPTEAPEAANDSTTHNQSTPVVTNSCFICNSNKQDFCEDAFNQNETLRHLKNCRGYFDNKTRDGAGPGAPADAKFYCTKTIISLEYNTVKSTRERIVRKCSYMSGKYGWNGCYHTRNSLYSTKVCKCEGDNCNSAGNIVASFFMVVAMLWASTQMVIYS